MIAFAFVCAFSTSAKTLSLILVPALTFLLIVALVIVLWPRSGKDNIYLMLRSLFTVRNLSKLPQMDKKTLKKLRQNLKIAVEISDSLASDEFYELSAASAKLADCLQIVEAVRLTGDLEGFERYGAVVLREIDAVMAVFADLNLLPQDLLQGEDLEQQDLPQGDELLRRAGEIFSQKYKLSKAKKLLAHLDKSEKNEESEQNKK